VRWFLNDLVGWRKSLEDENDDEIIEISSR
jgi:hypothetical protein